VTVVDKLQKKSFVISVLYNWHVYR